VTKLGRIRWVGYVAHVGKPNNRGEDNTEMDLKEIEWEVVDWINLSQDKDKWQAIVTMVMNVGVA
jgi:hypothetical protein